MQYPHGLMPASCHIGNKKPASAGWVGHGRHTQAITTAMKAMRKIKAAPAKGTIHGITSTISSAGSASLWCASCWGAWDMIKLQMGGETLIDFNQIAAAVKAA
jgi:hypothetical protein